IYVMDSGMAAVLGATLDPVAALKDRVLTLDVATSHTVGAVLEQGELCGFFEYHTRDITIERLETLLPQLAAGNLDHNHIP
ncbi:MAG: pyruvate formate-lyase activating enzyme, partial [Deltaproteobacteria bacterium]